MRRKRIWGFPGAALIAVFLCACGNTGNTGSTGNTAIDDVIDNVSSGISNLAKPAQAEDFDFREDIAGSIGDHIVYSSNLFEGRKLSDEEKEEMVECLNAIDPTLTEDVYLTGSAKIYDGTLRFYGRQYLDGAVVQEVFYATDLDAPLPNLVLAPSSEQPVKTPDMSGLIPAEEFFADVRGKAETHSSELNDYYKNGVYGTYLLCYDINSGVLQYDFTVNDYSHIIFDAKTGSTIEEYYFDGAIPD